MAVIPGLREVVVTAPNGATDGAALRGGITF